MTWPFRRRSKTPTIVQVAAYYPPHLGGLERVVQELAEELGRRGFRVRVLTSSVGRDRSRQRVHAEGNLRVERLRSFEFAHTPFMPGLLWRLLLTPKPAIFHLHLAQAHVPEITWLAARLRGIPYVVHFHLDVEPSGPLGFLFVWYKKTIQRVVIRGAQAVIALSEEQKQMLETVYKKPSQHIHYIPNGVSEAYLRLGQHAREPHRPLRLLYVGRLAVQKRVDRLLKALAATQAPVVLDVVGDGEDRTKLEALAQELQLHNVTFRGALHDTDLRQAYQQADVFVLPSDREGMPLVMLEAMAAGLPVIGSYVQGIREHLEGVGVLVKNPSPKHFAAAIDTMWQQKNTYYQRASVASYQKAQELSWGKLATRLIKLYDKLLTPRPRLQITRLRLIVFVALWWAVVLGARLEPRIPAYLANVLGFSFMIVVPGMLTLLCLRIRRIAPWAKLVMAIGLSLLELMLIGLGGNVILQYYGITRPLDTPWIIAEVSALVGVLLVLAWWRLQEWSVSLSTTLRRCFPTSLNILVALAPLLFICLAAAGASTLNNGGSGRIAMVMVGGVILYMVMVLAIARRLTDTALATALFGVALALLFMTSLRGWYVTGHDIQREFRVFQLAKDTGVWRMEHFQDAYNACMSITILPTMFANVLRLADPYIYKLLFQVIFATAAPMVLLIARRWTSKAIATMAAFYFVAFPTFFGDMPMLNRQEIALTFFGLMIYLLFETRLSVRARRLLAAAFATGIVLSHYSTTYSLTAIFGLVIMLRPALWLTGRLGRRLRLFRQSSVVSLRQQLPGQAWVISPSLVVFILLISFVWTTLLTQTGGSLTRVVRETVTAVQGGFREDRASDATNLISFAKTNPAERLADYERTAVGQGRAETPVQDLYPETIYGHYPVTVAAEDTLPPTDLTRAAQRNGINIARMSDIVRETITKLIEVLIVLGMLYVVFRKTYTKEISGEWLALAIACLLFVGLNIALPLLSVEYGLLRALQQSFFILGPFIVVGSIGLGNVLAKPLHGYVGALMRLRLLRGTFMSKGLRRAVVNGFPIVLAVLFMGYSSGLVTQITGGHAALLHFNNQGIYYDTYYAHPAELLSNAWLNQQTSNPDDVQSEVLASRVFWKDAQTLPETNILNDLHPGLIRRGSYVYLGYANTTKRVSAVSHGGDIVQYTYPVQFLDDHKDLLYSNDASRVYR